MQPAVPAFWASVPSGARSKPPTEPLARLWHRVRRPCRRRTPCRPVDVAGRGGRVAGRHEPPRPVLLHQLPEAARVREDHRLPEREPREQHAGDVHGAVRQHEQVGAAEEGGQLGVAHVARHEPHVRGRAEGLERHAQRAPHHPQLGAVHRAERVHQHVDSLVRPHDAEAQHDRAFHRGQLGRQRALVRLPREVLERPVRNHVHARAATEQLGPVAGVDDRGVHPLGQPPPGALAPDHVVHGEHLRPAARQEPGAHRLEPEPLPVLEVGRCGAAAHAQRAGHVLGRLERSAQGRAPSRVARR